MKRLVVLALVGLVMMTAAVTQSQAQTSNGPWVGKRLAIAHITLYDEWCKGVYDEFMTQGKEMGFGEINIQDGNLNAETQQKQVENFIAQKYDMILIDPVSPEGIEKTLDKAKAAGIPVIAFDSNTPWPGLLTHVSWDNAEEGRVMGRYVADYAKKNLGGKIKIGLLEMLDAPHTAIRGVEFKKVLEAQLGKSNITYVFEQDFGQTRESANNIVNNNIAKPMDVIWCAVDNAAQGARIALKNNGIEGTKLISSAWGNEPFNELNSNDPNYFMCVGISPYDIVKTSLMSAKAYFQGKASSLSREQNTPLAIIDQNNIGDYMKYVTKK